MAKRCTYCDNESKNLTREHIIPKSIIDKFPNSDLAFDNKSKKGFFKGESQIKDVCEKCNGSILSKLDKYGASFIERYFLVKYDSFDNLEIKYDYNLLLRWLLKIIYNSERANHKDISFFKNNIDYILGKNFQLNQDVLLFCGLFSYNSPIPEELSGQLEILIQQNPMLYINDNLTLNDIVSGDEKNKFKFNSLENSFLIRIGSAMFLIAIFKKNKDNDELKSEEYEFTYKFPFSKLSLNKFSSQLEVCSDPFSPFAPAIIRERKIVRYLNFYPFQKMDFSKINKSSDKISVDEIVF